MTTEYKTWGEVPMGVMVHNGTWRLIKCRSGDVTVGSVRDNPISAGWVTRSSYSRFEGPFYQGPGIGDTDPRKWWDIADVPEGVKVRNPQGTKWRKRNGRYQFKTQGRWVDADPGFVGSGPLTEVVLQVHTGPRQWQNAEDIPEGVTVRSRVGNKWRRKTGVWQAQSRLPGNRWVDRIAGPLLGPFVEVIK